MATLTGNPKLSREWGEETAEALWRTYRRFPVPWKGARVLDFGCSWGYFSKLLLEKCGASEVHGVDIVDYWNKVQGDFSPARVPGLKFFQGDVFELPELRQAEYDVIFSAGTLMSLSPLYFERVIAWFHEHLAVGGTALLQARTFLSINGGDYKFLRGMVPHLLFPKETLDRYCKENGLPVRTMLPYCGATYLMLYRAAGFEIIEAKRAPNPLDEQKVQQHRAKLAYYDPVEMNTRNLTVVLRKPSRPLDVDLLRAKLL
jgi:cyclopropane fatty-acyl-phospholipid synthase-like methyltransferase